MAENARVIKLFAPIGNTEKVRFLADIQNISIKTGPMEARVIVNSRTGSVVINRHVTLDACAVAQGDLSRDFAQQSGQPA